MRELKQNILRRALLLDYYGGLLTEKQREVYSLYFQEDLSLGEIADSQNVSRNAVFDLVTRTDEKLEKYEKALGYIKEGEEKALALDELKKELASLNIPEEKREHLNSLLEKLE